MRCRGLCVGLALLLPACTSGDDSAEPSWIADVDSGAESTFSLDDAPASLDAVLAQLPHLHGAPMFEVYDAIMSFADEHCPAVSSDPDGGSLWDTRCTASSGAEYSGFVSVYRGTQAGTYYQNMRGEATVTLPDGVVFVAAGDAHTAAAEDGSRYQTQVNGLFHWSGPVSEGAILADGWETSLAWEKFYTSQHTLARVEVDGNVALPEGDITAVAFEDVVFVTDAGSPCTLEPAGEIAMRDASGAWHSILFDVTAEADGSSSVVEGQCDGCGTVWEDGEALGQVCIDATLLDSGSFPPW